MKHGLVGFVVLRAVLVLELDDPLAQPLPLLRQPTG
jgi:hypothetical protein